MVIVERLMDAYRARIHRGWGAGVPDPPPPEKSQKIGFMSNTGLDPIKNHNTTKPAFKLRPSSARQRNTYFAGGLMMARF